MIKLGDICGIDTQQYANTGSLIADKPELQNDGFWSHGYSLHEPGMYRNSTYEVQKLVLLFDISGVAISRIVVYSDTPEMRNRRIAFWRTKGFRVPVGVSTLAVGVATPGHTPADYKRYGLCSQDSTRPVGLAGQTWTGVRQFVELHVTVKRAKRFLVTVWLRGGVSGADVSYNGISCFLISWRPLSGRSEYRRYDLQCSGGYTKRTVGGIVEVEGHGEPVRLVRVTVAAMSAYEKDARHEVGVSRKTAAIIQRRRRSVTDNTSTGETKIAVPYSSSDPVSNIGVTLVATACFILMLGAGVVFALKTSKPTETKKHIKSSKNEQSGSLTGQGIAETEAQRERKLRVNWLKQLTSKSMSGDDIDFDFRSAVSKVAGGAKKVKVHAKKKRGMRRRGKSLRSTTSSGLSYQALINQPDYVSAYLFSGTSNTSRLADRERELGIFPFREDSRSASRVNVIEHVARKRVKSRRALKLDEGVAKIGGGASRTGRDPESDNAVTKSGDDKKTRESRNRSKKLTGQTLPVGDISVSGSPNETERNKKANDNNNNNGRFVNKLTTTILPVYADDFDYYGDGISENYPLY